MNAEEPLVAAIRMLATLCLEVKQKGPDCEQRFRRFPDEPTGLQAPGDYPSSLAAGQFIARKLLRSAVLRLQSRGRRTKWFVAMRPNSGRSISDSGGCDLSGFKEIPLPQGSEAMADPFLVEVNGRTWLLFEDMPVGAPRGRLGAVEISEKGASAEMTVVMERDCHLSYPCVVPANGELFLLPESCGVRQVNLYRFTRFPDQAELVSTLLDGLGVVDTTPFFLDDHWYFFTTTVQPFMETLLFSSNRLDGPWTLHPCSPISCSVRNSRSAGHLFMRNGRLFRPTQDCSVRYGYAITVNEVTRLTPAEFSEHPVNQVLPSWAPGLLGTHTWNESSMFQVVDGIRLRS
jgi:hypothetical protein